MTARDVLPTSTPPRGPWRRRRVEVCSAHPSELLSEPVSPGEVRAAAEPVMAVVEPPPGLDEQPTIPEQRTPVEELPQPVPAVSLPAVPLPAAPEPASGPCQACTALSEVVTRAQADLLRAREDADVARLEAQAVLRLARCQAEAAAEVTREKAQAAVEDAQRQAQAAVEDAQRQAQAAVEELARRDREPAGRRFAADVALQARNLLLQDEARRLRARLADLEADNQALRRGDTAVRSAALQAVTADLGLGHLGLLDDGPSEPLRPQGLVVPAAPPVAGNRPLVAVTPRALLLEPHLGDAVRDLWHHRALDQATRRTRLEAFSHVESPEALGEYLEYVSRLAEGGPGVDRGDEVAARLLLSTFGRRREVPAPAPGRLPVLHSLAPAAICGRAPVRILSTNVASAGRGPAHRAA